MRKVISHIIFIFITLYSILIIRSPVDCVRALLEIAKHLKEELTMKYSQVISEETTKLAEIFDLEIIFTYLASYHSENSVIRTSTDKRVAWETHGQNEFANFWSYVCRLPQVQEKMKCNNDLTLLPHDSTLVLRRFKKVMFDMIWKNKYDGLKNLFVDRDGTPLNEHEANLSSIEIIEDEQFRLDGMFKIKLDDGKEFDVQLVEANIFALFYNHEDVYNDAGQEFCIGLDVALGGSGCEAIVEGFYSLVNVHKKAGGQSNEVLVKRAIVDWTLPHPIACPSTMREISVLYTEGDEEFGLKKHRSSKFFDAKGRSANKYQSSKVIDRHQNETARFLYVLNPDDV